MVEFKTKNGKGKVNNNSKSNETHKEKIIRMMKEDIFGCGSGSMNEYQEKNSFGNKKG